MRKCQIAYSLIGFFITYLNLEIPRQYEYPVGFMTSPWWGEWVGFS